MAKYMLASIVDGVVCLCSLSLAVTPRYFYVYIPDELSTFWQFKWNIQYILTGKVFRI